MRKYFLIFLFSFFTLFAAHSLYKTYPLWLLPSFDQGTAREIQKISEVVGITNAYYVDSLDLDKTVTSGIQGMLESLDPHSHYFSPREGQANDESFDGKYQGVGIQYDVIDGKINVITVIPNAPAERVGVQSGDHIVEIDGKSVIGIDPADVPKRLKGPKGTTVKIGVERSGFDELLYFTLERDEIPIFTINTFFMANDSTGYVWVNRFASTTSEELENAMITMERNGMKQLVLDLRGNGGGFLKEAVKMVAKFIPGHKLVVYTKGRLPETDNEYYTDDFGPTHTRDIPLILLINEASASASEIVSGALQDYDRALIVGQHSFGKGLVQNEFELNDGARLRLTVSKYYTPSGRLIQRPYKDKSIQDYYKDAYDSTSAVYDSTKRPKYHTSAGRVVYGGGGISPDVPVKLTTISLEPKLTQKLYGKRIFYEFAADYVNRHKAIKDDLEEFLTNFYLTRAEWQRFKKRAAEADISATDRQWRHDKAFLANRIKAEIARNIWSSKAYWRVILEYDNQLDRALALFEKAREFTQAAKRAPEKSD